MFVKTIVMALLVSLPTALSTKPDSSFIPNFHSFGQNKKEPVHTKEQKEKLRQAEEAADHFVKRWRETLDMNILFEELYVTNPSHRQRNILLYCGQCLEESGKVDNDTLKQAFFGFWNMYYLHWEYSLAFDEPDNDDLALPPGVEEMEKVIDEIDEIYGETGPQRGQIRQQTIDLVRAFDKTSDLFRRHLPREWFTSTRYKQNYQREFDENDKSEILDGGLAKFPVKPREVIYRVRRGEFELFFVEEAGQFKVLTFGYEL